MSTARNLLIALVSILSVIIFGNTDAANDIISLLEEKDPLWHEVISIADGDTITVDLAGQEETIRFIGVDTPETHHPSRPVQCFGAAATRFTTNLLEGEDVRLEADSKNTNRDRYGRLLRYVYTRDGTLVNSEIIRQGYGFAYLSFPFSKQTEFEALEVEAERESRGLWSSCDADLENGFPSTNAVGT